MKNEVMAKAVTGIDEKLISDAEHTKKKNTLRPVISICAVAACLVLVFTFIFASGTRRTEPELLMNDIKITDSPVLVESPKTAMARATNPSLVVYLTLNTKESTKIHVSDGEMTVVSAGDTDTLYYKGTEYTTDIPVNLHWDINDADTSATYTLTLGESEAVYTLGYDEVSSNWSICRQ